MATMRRGKSDRKVVDLGRSWIMGGGNTPVRIGMGPAALAAIAVVGLAWPLVEWPGAGALYLAYFAVVIVAAWKGGRNAALFVLVFVSCARLLLAPFSAAPSASGQHWEAWVVSLYYGAAVSSVLLLDSRGRIGPSSQPVPASRPQRDPPSALGLEVIPPQVFLERSREGIHILDMNGRLRWSNDRFREILGYSYEEARSLHAWDWDTRFTSEELLARLRQATTAGVQFETSFRRQDGSIIDVEVRSNRVEWKGQSFVYNVCQDITDRKRAEKALLESEQRFRLLVDQAGDGFFAAVLETAPDFVGIADPSGRVIYLNRAFKEALRRSPESEPLMIRDCHPPHVVRLLETEALPTAARLGVWKGDTEFVRWDGQVIPTSKLIISHTDTAGRVQYYSTIMRDISERKHLEDALVRHGQELAIANAELARASRLKDEFLASMSHELRTPLNGILNISQGLAEEVYGTMTPRQQEVLHDVEECGQHLLSLINDILDVAKIEAGKLDILPGPIAVGTFCQATLRLVKEAAQKKKLHLALELDESVSALVSDQRRLKQILVNLLSNAVKFTPEGGTVTLEVVGDRPSQQVRFNVRDTGIGINPDDLGRLFQPFVQLDSRLSRNDSGTGLGLALVKRLATLLGGQTLVQSQPGSGSCFTIVLPWNQEPEATVQEEVPAENQGESPDTPPAEQALVVLVEDNALTARVLRDYLCFKGFQVECASNAIHGLALIERLRPGLVIMDIQMPGIDGFQAIERIRRLTEVANVPIIALTALAMPGDRERCLQAGATAYAPKPVALDELLQLASRLAHARSCYGINI